MERWGRTIATSARGGVSLAAGGSLLLLLVMFLNQICNVGATACFAVSGHSDRLKAFVAWQIIGGFFGLGVQLTFAGLVRYESLSFANVWGIGVAFVAAQVFAAYMIFHESFTWPQWCGTGLVFAGLFLVAATRR